MANRAWAIKLGSAGRCIPFCERHHIVGIGWKNISHAVVCTDDKDTIWRELEKAPEYEGQEALFGRWTGSIHRFGTECSYGDFILYYDPSHKHVQIGRVKGSSFPRDFDLDALDTADEEVDIWHCLKIELACNPIPVVDFYGALKGKLLGPRGTIWQLHDQFELIEQIASGEVPEILIGSDPEVKAAKEKLEQLITARTEALTPENWELLAADYFRAQGAIVDQTRIGGTQSVLDFEAVFEHGEIPESTWRVQVKRYQQRQVDTPELAEFARTAGDAELCFISVFGFTEAAKRFAEEKGILLLKAENFSAFILTGKMRDSLQAKLLSKYKSNAS